MSKKPKLTTEEQATMQSETDAAQAENLATHGIAHPLDVDVTTGASSLQGSPGSASSTPPGPLSPARRLRVMSRVIKALKELPLVDQRGVAAVLSLADPGEQAAMREILTILRGVDLADDRRLILQGVASVVGAPEP